MSNAYKFLTKNGTALAFGLGVIVSVIGLGAVLGGIESFNMLAEEEQGTTSIFNTAIWGAIVLAVACFVLMILFGLIHVASNWRGAIEGIIGLAVIIGLTVVFYSTSEPETTGKVGQAIADGKLDANTSKWISGVLKTTLVLISGTVLVFIFSEIRNAFK